MFLQVCVCSRGVGGGAFCSLISGPFLGALVLSKVLFREEYPRTGVPRPGQAVSACDAASSNLLALTQEDGLVFILFYYFFFCCCFCFLLQQMVCI